MKARLEKGCNNSQG